MRAEGADGSSGKEYDGSTQPIKSHWLCEAGLALDGIKCLYPTHQTLTLIRLTWLVKPIAMEYSTQICAMKHLNALTKS